MWKPEHRRAADRTGLRYPSDLSDAEWLIVEPMIPPAKRGGRRRSVNVREVLNGIFYVLWTGCQWKALPKDLPPKSTVHDYLELWKWDGTLERIHHELYMAVREQEGREPSPTVAIIDSQTAKGSQKGGLGSILRATTRARRSRVASGTSWSTRWASCWTSSFIRPMFRTVMVLSTCCAGHDAYSRSSNSFLLMADMPDPKWHWPYGAPAFGDYKSSSGRKKRWIVERTFAWISRNRRLARDFERYATTVAAFVRLAMIRIMLRRLAANHSSWIQTFRIGS
jgi:transposase